MSQPRASIPMPIARPSAGSSPDSATARLAASSNWAALAAKSPAAISAQAALRTTSSRWSSVLQKSAMRPSARAASIASYSCPRSAWSASGVVASVTMSASRASSRRCPAQRRRHRRVPAIAQSTSGNSPVTGLASADQHSGADGGQRRVDLRAPRVDDLEHVVDRARTAMQRLGLVGHQLDLDHLDGTARTETAGHTGEDAAQTELTVEAHAAGQHLAGVEQDGVDHLRRGGAGRVEGAAGLEQVDDLGAAVAGALHDLLQAVARDQLLDADAGHRGEAGERHHGVAAAAADGGLPVEHPGLELLRDGGAGDRGVQ